MGIIYEAHDPDIDRTIALKVLRQDRVTSEAFVERFLKEAKAVGRLSHPNIVTVYDIGHEEGKIYIAMEFLAGTSLDKLVLEKKLSFAEIVNIGIQIADALQYAHQKGIVHRNIKPSNIIVMPNGQVKISDFGIARIEDPSAPQMTLAGEILGTPAYMAPEQVMGQPVDGRSDLFSLGCILYELFTGSRPFQGENLSAIFRSVTQDNPPEPEKINHEVQKELSDLIMRCLKKAPDERFQTGGGVIEGLQGYLKKRTVTVSSEAPQLKKSKKPVLFILGLLLIACIIGGFSYYFFIGQGVKVKATLHVESVPGGAKIIVDSSYKGKSPLRVDLPLGKHEVRLTLPDYYKWEAPVQFKKKEEVPLKVRLIPIE